MECLDETLKESLAVSVIVPMYNTEKFIGECLDSLLNQTFQNFEVIVVDDCSTDSSCAIVESYAPKFNGRLIMAKTEKNSGSGALPRNKGIELARGEYVFFMDADDLVTPTALEEMYTLAKEYKADVVYCEKYRSIRKVNGEFVMDDECCKGKTQPLPFVDKPTFETQNMVERVELILKTRVWVTAWNKLVKRELIIKNRIFFPHVRPGEDNIWVYGLIFYAKKFLRVPNVIYTRRFWEGSVMGTERTPQQKINFWLNPVLFGLKALDKLMNKHKFFKANPSYRFIVLKKFVSGMFGGILSSAEKLTEDVIYSTIKDEFGKRLGKYDVLISALCTVLYAERKARNNDVTKLREVINNFTARIDITLTTTEGDFQIVFVSDDKANITKPAWLNKNSIGYVITSYAGRLKFVAESTVDGQINLDLRGLDIRQPDDKSKRIPYWIDYTKLAVNGEFIFDKLTPAWHDKPYRYKINVKAGEEIKIQVEWLPHSSDT